MKESNDGKLNKLSKLLEFKSINLNIIVDDTGASEEISNAHLNLIKSAQVQGISVLPTGTGLDTLKHGLRDIPERTRKSISYSIHLDICEGSPLNIANLDAIETDECGKFSYSYSRLLIRLLFASNRKRYQTLRAIEEEWRFQISYLQEFFEGLIIFTGVNSHRHFHTNPFLLDISKKLAQEFNLNLRIPRERVYLPNCGSLFSKSYLIGICKTLIIKFFLRNEHGKETKFLGVLNSGKMNVNNVISGLLKNLSKSSNQHSETFEVLFHPGRDMGMRTDFTKKRMFRQWYSHTDRELEMEEIKRLRVVLDQLGI